MEIKLFKKKEKEFKKDSAPLKINFYWKMAVCFIFIVAIFSLAFGYYIFMQINQEEVIPPATSSGEFETVKVDRIFKVLEFFSLREQQSNQILNSPPAVIDPSL